MMKAIGMFFALFLTLSPLAIVNAQTSSPAAAPQNSTSPDVAKKSDLRRMQSGLEKKMAQTAAQQSAQLAELARQQEQAAEAQRKADAALLAEKQREQAQQQADAQRKTEETRAQLMTGAWTIAAFIVAIALLEMARRRSKRTPNPTPAEEAISEQKKSVSKLPTLIENATPTEIKAYAEATHQIGMTLDYPVRLEITEPTHPAEKIFIGRIIGKVLNAGTPQESYAFDGFTTLNAEKRFQKAFAAFKARQEAKVRSISA